MIIILEERKKQYLDYIIEEYRPKATGCWQTDNPVYFTTKDFCKHIQPPPSCPEETIIKFDLKRALNSSALFFILLFGSSFYHYIKKSGDFGIMLLFAIGYLILMTQQFNYQKKNIVQIKMDKNGIWLDTTQKWINWSQFIESFVRIEENDGSKYYVLIIHYYDSFHDRFFIATIKTEGLEIPTERIIAEMEYRKRITRSFYSR